MWGSHSWLLDGFRHRDPLKADQPARVPAPQLKEAFDELKEGTFLKS